MGQMFGPFLVAGGATAALITITATQAEIDALPDALPVDWPRASEHRIKIASAVNQILAIIKGSS